MHEYYVDDFFEDMPDMDGDVFEDAEELPPELDPDPGEDSSPLLAHLTKQSTIKPGDIRHVLATSRSGSKSRTT